LPRQSPKGLNISGRRRQALLPRLWPMGDSSSVAAMNNELF
jgi:hypothetical protein